MLLKSFKFILSFVIVVMSFACNSSFDGFMNDGPGDYRAVIKNSNVSSVEEFIIIFQLKIKDGGLHDGEYLVLPTVKDLTILIDDSLWGTGSTPERDVSHITDLYKGFRVSDIPYSYYAIIRSTPLDTDSANTAGQYSEYLNSGLISVGDHIFELTSLKIENGTAVETEVKPGIMNYLEIESDVDSKFVDEFVIEVTTINE